MVLRSDVTLALTRTLSPKERECTAWLLEHLSVAVAIADSRIFVPERARLSTAPAFPANGERGSLPMNRLAVGARTLVRFMAGRERPSGLKSALRSRLRGAQRAQSPANSLLGAEGRGEGERSSNLTFVIGIKKNYDSHSLHAPHPKAALKPL